MSDSLQSHGLDCSLSPGQAPQSMEFSRPEYWSGLPFPSPGDLPNSGIEPRSPMLYHLSHQGSPSLISLSFNISIAYLTPPYSYAGICFLEDKTQHWPKFLLERKKIHSNSSRLNTGTPWFTTLCYIVLHGYWIFHKFKVCECCIKKIYWCHFPNSICSLCVKYG